MAANGYGPAMAGHIGRIPNFGKTQPMGGVEPPACIQNAMMTKDKKPFTYTPGGLDLSQIRTPSMARRLARQRSLEDQEQANNAGYHPQGGPVSNNSGFHSQGGPVPPPPPPPKVPAPPPPPPIVIQVPNSKSPKPPALGERPEIVIPENPIGMLRKTNSPYHWESEKEQMQRMGPVPKFMEKAPSPLSVQMPPSNFSQQQPQSYTPHAQNYQQNYATQNLPGSPIHRPEAQYGNQRTPNPNGITPTREILQRQDSQFNKSPQPFNNQTPTSSPYNPSPNINWRQPEKRDSPATNSPQQSPQFNRGPFSPSAQQYSPNYPNQSPGNNSGPVFHTLPRVGQRNQENTNNSVMYNNTKSTPQTNQPEANVPNWKTNTLNRYPKEGSNQQNIYNNQNTNQQEYSPPWKTTANENNNAPHWKQDNRNQQQQPVNRPWTSTQDSNNNNVQDNVAPWRSQHNRAPPSPPKEQPRYQSTMSIPVTPRNQNNQPNYNTAPQKEAVYVTQEPVYYAPDSPKSIPPWVKTQKEKTKTPPPAWCTRPLEARKSLSRELVTPPRDINQEPEWVRRNNERREVISPPKYQQPVQPSWSTKPSENRKSLPKDNTPNSPGSRIIPIHMEVSTTETRNGNRQGNPQPQLRITIGMNQNPQDQTSAPFSPPTQRIMRVLSPQLVRLDDGPQQPDLPTLNKNYMSSPEQPKTRIIPIQIEGSSGANKSVYYHKFSQEGPPRQSKAFKVLQIITGTESSDEIKNIEKRHGFTDL